MAPGRYGDAIGREELLAGLFVEGGKTGGQSGLDERAAGWGQLMVWGFLPLGHNVLPLVQSIRGPRASGSTTHPSPQESPQL